MKSNNTFGVHFVLRTSRTGDDDKFPVYARITVNGTRCEFSMKQSICKKDWNIGKGEAKPKNPEMRVFNSYLQETQGKLARHYRELQIQGRPLTATAVKTAFLERKPPIPYFGWSAPFHDAKGLEARHHEELPRDGKLP